MVKSNDTIYIVKNQLKTPEQREKYLELITSRLEETKSKFNKISIILLILFLAFPLLQSSKIEKITIEPFEKIDTHLVLLCIPTIFSMSYFYYLICWLQYNQQRKILSHLTSIFLDIKYDSYLNKHIQPFSLLDILENYVDSKNATRIGYVISLITIPIMLLFLILPFLFICFSIFTLYREFELEKLEKTMIIVVPILLLISLILIFISNKHMKE